MRPLPILTLAEVMRLPRADRVVVVSLARRLPLRPVER